MEFADKVLHLMDGFATAFQSAAPSFHPSDLLVGLCCGAGLRLAVYIKGKNAQKYRHGTEYGSARWGTAKDIQPFVDPVFENNAILTQTEQITMNNRPKDPKTARNKNFLIIGGSRQRRMLIYASPCLHKQSTNAARSCRKHTATMSCLPSGCGWYAWDSTARNSKTRVIICWPTWTETVPGVTTRIVMKSTNGRDNIVKWRDDEMKIQIENDILSGTAAEIMDQLRGRAFDPTEFPDTESYIWFLQNNVIRTTGLEFPLPEGDVEQQARFIFDRLSKIGALTILEG